MNIVEQHIWDYLDGTCSMQETKNIEKLLTIDPVYRQVYAELKTLQDELAALDLDEPSMSFTRKVMDEVATVPVPGSVKALVDKKIIYGIAALFLVSILILLLMVFSQLDWSRPVAVALPQYKMPQINFSSYINPSYLRIFLLADFILGLYILDSVMRKRLLSK
jgi:hypothetical protein